MTPSNKPLRSVYFDPSRLGSYGGIDALRRVTRVPRKIVAEWLSEQDAFTLHIPARRHFRRRRLIVGGLYQQWQADLVDLSNLKKDNDGMTFLLTVIDVLSKVAWCVPMKNKSAASLVAALTTTFAADWLKTLQTDQRLEFLNKSVQALLMNYDITSETKASIEDAHVAILHETPGVAIHRRPSGLGAIVQQHPPSQHRYGAVTGKCTESRKGVAAHVRSRR